MRFRPHLKGFFISAEIFLAFAGELCYNLLRDVDISDPELIQNFLDEFVEDEIWSTPQYLSTTKSEEYNSDATIRIYIQNSRKGHDLGQYNVAEREVLYERGMKFKVLQKMRYESKWYIVLEEM